MMVISKALKAMADETRMELLTMLIKNSCCVSALARRLGVTEATVSQHLRILREAGLLTGEKHGHFTHYTVERDALRALAGELEALAAINRMDCTPEKPGCQSTKRKSCRVENSEYDCFRAHI